MIPVNGPGDERTDEHSGPVARGALTGSPISASNGHLLVIVGFEADGDVVVNDPAGATNAEVRRVYDRAQFERIWIAASGWTAYVVRHG